MQNILLIRIQYTLDIILRKFIFLYKKSSSVYINNITNYYLIYIYNSALF